MELNVVEDCSSNGSFGYDLDLFENKDFLQKYKCGICRNILRDALQIPQTQVPMRACRKCYADNIR